MVRKLLSQTQLLLWKNYLLFSRHQLSVWSQIIAPFLLCGYILMVQTMINHLLVKYLDPSPPTVSITTLPKCWGDPCVTLGIGYSAGETEWTRHVLTQIKERNGLKDRDFRTVTENNYLDMVNFLQKYPNQTQTMVFFCTGTVELPADLPPEVADYPDYMTCAGANASNLYVYSIIYNFTSASSPFIVRPDEPSPIDHSILPLKLAIDNAILSYRLREINGPEVEITAEMSDYPHSVNRLIQGYDTVTMQGPLYFFLPPMIVFIMVMTEMVREKELGLRQVVNTLGTSQGAFWLSWIVTGLVFTGLGSTLTTLAGRWIGFDFFHKSEFWYFLFRCVWLIFFMFTNAMVTFGYFLVTIMSSGKMTYTVTYSLMLAGLVLQGFISSHLLIICLYVTDLVPWFHCIRQLLVFYPPFNFATAFYEVSRRSSSHPIYGEMRWEEGTGYEWKHFFSRPEGWLRGHHFITPSLYDSLCNMGINILLFGVLAWFCDHVVSSNRGVAEPVYFLFTRKYWGLKPPRRQQYIEMADISKENSTNEEGEDSGVHSSYDKDGIRISYLSKTYPRLPCGFKSQKDVIALHNVTLTANRNEVLSLLGHNGAGKSTLLSILSGILAPSAGSAYLCGEDIAQGMEVIRQKMGVCPQHSILWDELTAEEHVYLFMRLKGYGKREAVEMGRDMLRGVELEDVSKAQVGTFSGGMRRRMCIALSGVGNPDIILMDEPTTGLDPISRSQVWKLIQRIKQGKVVVLTTHSMEEADALSDRIAILAGGEVKCQGTSLALKNTYGSGYRVSLVTLKPDRVRKILDSNYPAVTVTDQSADSILVTVPRGHLPTLQSLFTSLEEGDLAALVSDWGVSNTTLEDVFMTVTGKIDAESR